jgi:hypothetical protein
MRKKSSEQCFRSDFKLDLLRLENLTDNWFHFAEQVIKDLTVPGLLFYFFENFSSIIPYRSSIVVVLS